MTISILMMIAVIFTGVLVLTEPQANYSEDYYAELDAIFNKRAEIQSAEMTSILARYEPIEREIKSLPEQAAKPDTVIADTSKTENSETNLININKAGPEELQQLPGVGPAYAKRIVEWREKNGHFTTKEQLLEIRGIGPARLAAIRDLIEL